MINTPAPWTARPEWAVRACSLMIGVVITGRAAYGDQLQRWDRAVCLQSVEQTTEESRKHLATAFVVRYQDRVFLVTADHGARHTSKSTRVLYADSEGRPQWVSLRALCPGDRSPWRRFENSDLATAEIKPADLPPPLVASLQRLAISLTDIAAEDPVRTANIDVAGFPMGLGLQHAVSPIVVKGHIASRAISTENEWGVEPILYSFPALAEGTSGGPVFLSDPDPAATRLVGMYVGVIFDKSGAKLSRLVPSRLIRRAVIQHAGSDENAPHSDIRGDK